MDVNVLKKNDFLNTFPGEKERLIDLAGFGNYQIKIDDNHVIWSK
jgi:hypothetical protein